MRSSAFKVASLELADPGAVDPMTLLVGMGFQPVGCGVFSSLGAPNADQSLFFPFLERECVSISGEPFDLPQPRTDEVT